MTGGLIECVPNFSEGRNAHIVEAIAAAIRGVAGVALLDTSLDADHNRSVITFAGEPEAVAEAALRGVAEAARLIDLTRHCGVHPRIGATDVVPFIPLGTTALADCVTIARSVGMRIWTELGVPVYFYEAAALRPGRRNLAELRRGQFEGLSREGLASPARRPDFGGDRPHPTAGVTAVGARKFLIAYNINLATREVEIARQIARKIRQSSGGFQHVKAMGVLLESQGLAQVSMNLTDFEETPVDAVYESVEREAARRGVRVASSEVVGLVPKKAFEMAPEFYRRAANFRPDVVLETRLAEIQSK
ncbi:MAG TPA: glutamate formimidoyltransferase [Bryobacteraceae bacterium]|nr:glutamate formimidoyltransferase [Bryobacteraceae bacterium]